ncbi:hypothetical protein C8T65DRAFT_701970 [Cerioporus squamosus]|nr:hypothetical protein C8T65DRAFT_701970 [Cerioporus squamosus]
MAPRKWSSDDQWDWLLSRTYDWRDSQKSNTTTPWIAGTCHEWFSGWCEEDAEFGKGNWQRPFTLEQHERLAKAIERRKVQIQTWYHNHGHRNPGQNKTVKASAPEAIPRIKNTRALQEIEIYSKRYYHAKVKSVVKAELRRVAAERGVSKLPREERLPIVRTFTADAYENESDVVKREIVQAAAEDKQRSHALAEAAKKPVTNPKEERTPEEYQQ